MYVFLLFQYQAHRSSRSSIKPSRYQSLPYLGPSFSCALSIIMKFSIISSLLLPLASATIIYPSTTSTCGNNIGTFSSCGDTTLRNYNILSARVNFERATARMYRDIDSRGRCAGTFISVASDRCQNVPWGRILCIRICGGTCSNAC